MRNSHKIGVVVVMAIFVCYNMTFLSQCARSAEISDEWPMFHHDLQHTGYSTSKAPNTNNTTWNYTIGAWISSSPAVADGKVYIGSENYNVYCLNASTGAFIWSYKTGAVVYSSPAVADGRVYIGSWDYKVYCFGLEKYVLTVHVAKRLGGKPIQGVNVTVYRDSIVVDSAITGMYGDAILQAPAGTYKIVAKHHLFGPIYLTKAQTVEISEDTTVTFTFLF